MTRERDSLGRPLPSGDPRAVPGVDPTLVLDNDAVAWSLVCDHLAADRPFHAHEVAELRWRQCTTGDSGSSREAWRAVAQWGAALTHAARGNDVGATRLAQRALMTLDSAPHVPAEIDIDQVRASCAALLGDVAGAGVDATGE